jgi:NADPH:quinone reductase-like Zn-dependent oxidoreductase
MKGRAIVYRRYGLPEQVLSHEERDYLAPGAGKVRVRMRYSPVNPSDLIPVTGAYRHRIVLPAIAGYEGVGEVVSSDNRQLIGKRVLPLRGEGTWQSYVDISEQRIITVPDDINDVIAARAYINPLAALLMIKKWSPLGKNIVITGAGSACSRLLIQWAMECGARHISAIYRTAGRRKILAQAGAEAVSCYHSEKILQAASRADIIYDAVGGDLASMMLSRAPQSAQFISYGLLSGKMFSLSGSGPVVQRFHVRDVLENITDVEWQQLFIQLWSRLRQTELPPVRLFDMAEWQQALVLFRQPGREEKPLLRF